MTLRWLKTFRVTPKSTFVLVCFIAMLCCVVAEGGFLALGSLGAFSPTPGPLIALYCAWFLVLIATFTYFKWPRTTLLVAWLFLFLSSIVVWRYLSNEQSVVWFLYQHSLELGYIVASHAGYFIGRRRTSRS